MEGSDTGAAGRQMQVRQPFLKWEQNPMKD
jgi:hypothetical protein